nr:MAG TPA: hypothetical protein [Caudoviricetes sp.]
MHLMCIYNIIFFSTFLHNATILSYYVYIITLKVIFFIIICLHNIEFIKESSLFHFISCSLFCIKSSSKINLTTACTLDIMN